MITLNIATFLALLVGALTFGAWVAVRVQREIVGSDERVRRFIRDVDVCDQADMGEQR